MLKLISRCHLKTRPRRHVETPWRGEIAESALYKPASEQVAGEEIWTPEELVAVYGKDALLPFDSSCTMPRIAPKNTTIDLHMTLAEAAVKNGEDWTGIFSVALAKEILALPRDQARAKIWENAKQVAKSDLVKNRLPTVPRPSLHL